MVQRCWERSGYDVVIAEKELNGFVEGELTKMLAGDEVSDLLVCMVETK